MAEMNVFAQKWSLRADEMRSVNEEREEENGWQIILPFVFVFVFVFVFAFRNESNIRERELICEGKE